MSEHSSESRPPRPVGMPPIPPDARAPRAKPSPDRPLGAPRTPHAAHRAAAARGPIRSTRASSRRQHDEPSRAYQPEPKTHPNWPVIAGVLFVCILLVWGAYQVVVVDNRPRESIDLRSQGGPPQLQPAIPEDDDLLAEFEAHVQDRERKALERDEAAHRGESLRQRIVRKIREGRARARGMRHSGPPAEATPPLGKLNDIPRAMLTEAQIRHFLRYGPLQRSWWEGRASVIDGFTYGRPEIAKLAVARTLIYEVIQRAITNATKNGETFTAEDLARTVSEILKPLRMAASPNLSDGALLRGKTWITHEARFAALEVLPAD